MGNGSVRYVATDFSEMTCAESPPFEVLCFIESTFPTIRLRTAKTSNCLSEKTALSTVHQFAMSAEKRWRHLRGFRHLADVLVDVRFTNGVDETETSRRADGFRTAIHHI